MLAFLLHLRFLEKKRALKFGFSLFCSFYFGCQLESKKCPDCYGNDLCQFFENRQIQLTWFGCILSIVHPDWTKSVFHGIFNETQVVVKRKITRKVEEHLVQNVVLCPNVRDLVFLFEQIEEIREKKLWLDISTSIEPLLLKYFQSLGTWPFPGYYGSCGDLIVEEYKGEPLTSFHFLDFETKVSFAIQLLRMADMFTFGHSELAFYFTDYSLHNLVVDSSGKISLIDLDNVIIYNKSASRGSDTLNRTIHTSEILDDLKYAFSPSDICDHYISDHNFFSVCQYLLTHANDGLLNDIPEFEKQSELLLSLNECTKPNDTGNRIVAGRNLQTLLEEIQNLHRNPINDRGRESISKGQIDFDATAMTVNLKVFKKSSPNGKITLYLGKRDFVDHVSFVDPIDGVVVVADEYTESRKIFGQIVCSFRYGREEDEVMGLNFQKDFYLASGQIYPSEEQKGLTRLQERLLKKLGPNAYPFTFRLSPNAPTSITLQPGPEDEGQPCGLHYYVKIFAGENESDRSQRRSTVTFGIRKVQFAPSKQGRRPCTIVRKAFMLSFGELELEMTLDKQLYHHGETVVVSVCIRNNSNKVVKKIKAMVQQGVDIVLFQNGQYRSTVACIETQEGCPVQPGSRLQKLFHLIPTVEGNQHRRGIALEGQIKNQQSKLASSSLLASPDSKDVFGIIVSYSVKVKLFLGALGGEVVAELPMLLMQPKPSKQKRIKADDHLDSDNYQSNSDVATD